MTEEQTKQTKELWVQVLNKGRETKDRKTISEVFKDNPQTIIILRSVSWNFLNQTKRDSNASYRYYDGLAMWLGQAEFFPQDLWAIIDLAKLYLKEEKDEKKI